MNIFWLLGCEAKAQKHLVVLQFDVYWRLAQGEFVRFSSTAGGCWGLPRRLYTAGCWRRREILYRWSQSKLSTVYIFAPWLSRSNGRLGSEDAVWSTALLSLSCCILMTGLLCCTDVWKICKLVFNSGTFQTSTLNCPRLRAELGKGNGFSWRCDWPLEGCLWRPILNHLCGSETNILFLNHQSLHTWHVFSTVNCCVNIVSACVCEAITFLCVCVLIRDRAI